MSAAWVIGFSAGAAVVVLVVALLLLMIRGASRAASKAEDILAALEEARDNTDGLWLLRDTNHQAGRIVEAAAAARAHLSEKGDRR